MRLNPERLGALPAAVARPLYDRSALRAGIVHLGAGAFQRAHLAAATEIALHADGDLRWGITGVSLRSADTAEALLPQHGLYTLALRDAGPDGAPREALQVIGAMPRLLVAPREPGAALDAIASDATRIVSLTVTEKGYHLDPATRTLRRDDADLTHDAQGLQPAVAPCTTLGVIAHGLQRRRAAGRSGVTLLSCDNLSANGNTLRGLLLEFASRLDTGLAAWIESECSFPNSMVDRIVPRTTDADRARIGAALGMHDAWPVVAEPFFDWVVEDRFVAGRPAWQHGGARFVADAAPFEHAKLRLVNGCHSAIAYLGVLAGWDTVDQALSQAALRRWIERLMHDEIALTLPPTPGLDPGAYGARLLQRFANPALQHRTRQIAMDGSQKIPPRWLGTVRDRLAAGRGIERLALAVAAWLQFLGGVDEAGRSFPIDDPLADALAQHAATARDGNERIRALCAFTPVFGDLGALPRFVGAVERQAQRLRTLGVVGALEG